MGLFSSGKDDRNPDEHTVKPAGKATWQVPRARMHETHGEWRLAELAGDSQRDGERPAMDRNRRP